MVHDLRFAVRQLWKAPGFTIAAVLVLTLGAIAGPVRGAEKCLDRFGLEVRLNNILL
jgi:hypothetical protein